MEKFKVVAKPSEEAESGWARSFTVIRAGRGQARHKQAEEENRQGSQTGTRTQKAPSRAAIAPETPPYPQSGDQEQDGSGRDQGRWLGYGSRCRSSRERPEIRESGAAQVCQLDQRPRV